MTIRLLAHSNSQSLEDLPIQITSMEEEVTKNPSHTKKPHISPVPIDGPPVYVEVDAKRYTAASAYAVARFTTKFQNSLPYMSDIFSFPVGCIFAKRIHNFPATGPCIKNPIIKSASAATKTAT